MAYEKLVTHYDNLKVANNAPLAVIRAAYRALVQQFHPDKFLDQVLAEHRIKIINKAYEVLSHTERRREHDAWIIEQKAMRTAQEKLHAAQAAGLPGAEARAGTNEAPRVQFGSARHRGHQARLALRASLIGMGRVVERLALFAGVSLLAYVLVIEKPHLPPSPALIEDPGPALSSYMPSPVTETTRAQTTIDDAARCFWVYTPIAETGRDFPHDGLFQFGQQRIRWFDTFLKGNSDNPDFKQVFESGIRHYQPSSSSFRKALWEALSKNDPRMYALVMEAAVSCDQSLGIRTQFVPRM